MTADEEALKRLKLIRTLNALPPTQFDELVFSLNLPPGTLPTNPAPQGNRGLILLQWAEGSTGHGLSEVIEILGQFTGTSAFTPDPPQPIRPLRMAPEPKRVFTGRESLLTEIHQTLAAGELAALSGLGGIGKTELAIEYAHRHTDNYSDILWILAESENTLVSDLDALARTLGLPLDPKAEDTRAVQAVKTWLRQNPGWLLIFDNADHPSLIRDWRSLKAHGHILLTTQAAETRPIAECISVPELSLEDGALFLLRRTHRIAPGRPLTDASTEQQSDAVELSRLMGGLPLALDQAGAFILELSSDLAEYLKLFQGKADELLARRGQNALAHFDSVTVTFSLALERASQEYPALIPFLHLCAFLAPDAIPEELFTGQADRFEAPLQDILNAPYEFLRLLEAANNFSLIRRTVETKTMSLHRLVQDVVRGRLDESTQETQVRQLTWAMRGAFPAGDFENWAQ